MAVHLIKLCVGVDSIADLQAWLDGRPKRGRRAAEHIHVTRMAPTRRDELLAGGSLYWVIRGWTQVRQRLVDIRPVAGDDGVPRCGLVLEPALVPTAWQPRRPFQGWRYLDGKDAPRDLASGGEADLPPALRAELAELGLL